ncbi:MAG: hypothetical protein ACRC4T_18045 [Cetobacterium sp.]
MSTITANKGLYKINKNFNSEIKKIFGEYFKSRLYEKLELKRIKENVFFKEINTDLLYVSDETIIDSLIKAGYDETDYQNYTSTVHNSIEFIKDLEESKFVSYDNSIVLNGRKVIVNKNKNKISLIYEDRYELLLFGEYEAKVINNFVINSEGFIYMVITDNNSDKYFIRSHLSLEFFRYNSSHNCMTKLEEIECLFKEKINENIKEIIFDDDNGVNFISDNLSIKRIEFGRKYFFRKDENVFFNKNNFVPNVELQIIQVEHLHLYDWISFLGLNNFVNDKGLKLNSEFIEKFKNIIRFKFDDTLNGALNYYDFYDEKDYKVDFFQDGIEVVGNFKYGYFEKGDYTLNIKVINKKYNGEFEVILDLIRDNKNLKRLVCTTVDRVIYFSNLKFNFVSFDYLDNIITLKINIKDDYSVKSTRSYVGINTEIKITDFDRLIKLDQVLRNENINKKQLIDVEFIDNFLIIKNYAKNSSERMFESDFKIRLIEDDGTPTVLWKQIKDKDYFINFNNYCVKKVIKPTRKIKPLLKSSSINFKLNLKKGE